LVKAVLVPSEENSFAVFDAAIADAVVAAGARPGITFARIVEVHARSGLR
jgi:hypothetical protein